MPRQPRAYVLIFEHIMRRDHYTCQMCDHYYADGGLTVHHIIPREKGGPSTEENLITLCHTCHNEAEAEQLPTADIIRNWYPEAGRKDRIYHINHVEEKACQEETEMPEDTGKVSTGTCERCHVTGEAYKWRYFDGQRDGDVLTLCLSCYYRMLNTGHGMALVLGQTVPDRRPGSLPLSGTQVTTMPYFAPSMVQPSTAMNLGALA